MLQCQQECRRRGEKREKQNLQPAAEAVPPLGDSSSDTDPSMVLSPCAAGISSSYSNTNLQRGGEALGAASLLSSLEGMEKLFPKGPVKLCWSLSRKHRISNLSHHFHHFFFH